ncbi:uncharacterized protein LOC135345270 [Halichondria panicea]|uniref:uncharacterized protein LOC135345270 n=1 Tax=Halichondria panicea TaxID=6063 RepID=UPI00312BC0AD
MAMEVQKEYIQRHYVPLKEESISPPLQDKSYSVNYIQGPPPLISDQPKTITMRTVAQSIQPSTSSRPANYTGPSMSQTNIPGVYFGYQIQQEERLQRSPGIMQPTTQQTQQRMVISPTLEPPVQDENTQEDMYTSTQEVAAGVQVPPPLVPTTTPSANEKLEHSYLSQQIMKSTSTLLNFIQMQVLSSINGTASSIQNGHLKEKDLLECPMAVDSDGFRPVPNLPANEKTNDNQNTGIEHQPLTSYERNLFRDLQIQSRLPNSNKVSSVSIPPSLNSTPSMQMQPQYTDTEPYIDGRKRRQKKTREEKLAYLRQYARERRARETPGQREARLADLRARQRARKANETSDQRKLRLEKDRLKTGRYRAKKKQDDDMSDMFEGNFEAGFTEADIIDF